MDQRSLCHFLQTRRSNDAIEIAFLPGYEFQVNPTGWLNQTFLWTDGSLVLYSSSKVQMDYICLQYPGYFRFAKWMERLAQGIADGVIEVPKDH